MLRLLAYTVANNVGRELLSTPQPRPAAHAAVMPATVTAGVACVISALGAVEGVRLYTSHNAARCGGGLGWLGPGLGLFGTLAIALLITLIALVTTLIVAFARHRWLWIIALFLVIALAVLVVINSTPRPPTIWLGRYSASAAVGSTRMWSCLSCRSSSRRQHLPSC